MMKKMTEANLKRALSRSISDPDILERTFRDTEVMDLYNELTIGMFNRMAERIIPKAKSVLNALIGLTVTGGQVRL